ncbi:MAG: M23 family metallopeptidase [Chloroflexota bacterium]
MALSQRRLLSCVVLLLITLFVGPLQAEPTSRLFPETGWSVEGRILDFWESNGGLPVFGLPLAPAMVGDNGLTYQQFERNRLELHPENAAPYDVQLGRLGDALLTQQGRDWQNEPDEQLLESPCEEFADTGRQMCGPFLEYWRSYGLELGDDGISYRESLALFGMPLTGTRTETDVAGNPIVVQWLERARFEYHPNNPDPYKVLLGRLGAEVGGEPQGLPLPSVRILPDAAIVQGHTAVIEVAMADATEVRGRLGYVELTFMQTATGWRALGAVHALQSPGALGVVVEATLADGRVANTTALIQVLDANYPVERINLPPAVTESIANNQEALAEENATVRAIWPNFTPERYWDGPWIMPAEGRITSLYGPRRSYNGGPANSFHEGLDIANAIGTPIVAPARGRVVLTADNYVARGGTVILDHGLGVHTGYWHMEEVLVTNGQFVEAGNMIGRMGTRGMSTGSHLHWELRIGPTSVDPTEWLEREWLGE